MATKRAVYQIAEFKAITGKPGEFTALVSVFGNVDLQGDRVVKGAFQKSLARWNQKGDPIPVIWSHHWDDPFAHIGEVTSAREVNGGLEITGKNDIDKPFAGQVHDLLTSRRVKEWSFAYDVIDERRAKDGANELLELNLIEVGPTLKGANPETETLLAKAAAEEAAQVKDDATAQVKAGRRLSQATRARLQAMRDELNGLLAEDDDEDGKSVEPEPDPEDEGAPDGDTDLDESEPETQNDEPDRKPEAKSADASVIDVRTRIAEIRATTGISA